MRFQEFEKDARKQLAERYNLTEEQLDEIIPAIGAIAGGVARAGVGLAARGAGALARGAAKGAAALGRGAAKGAASLGRTGAKAAGRALARNTVGTSKNKTRSIAGGEPSTNDPNDTVGTQDKQPMGTQSTVSTQKTSPASNTQSNIKVGQRLKLPAQTATGKPGPKKPFKITKVKGDEIELSNPTPKPGEPKRFTYNKADLEGNIE